jgi:hypothetical protein
MARTRTFPLPDRKPADHLVGSNSFHWYRTTKQNDKGTPITSYFLSRGNAYAETSFDVEMLEFVNNPAREIATQLLRARKRLRSMAGA